MRTFLWPKLKTRSKKIKDRDSEQKPSHQNHFTQVDDLWIPKKTELEKHLFSNTLGKEINFTKG